jgi:hypothetical protein
MFDRAEAVHPAEIVHAVHVQNPTAVTLLIFELFDRGDRVLEVRAQHDPLPGTVKADEPKAQSKKAEPPTTTKAASESRSGKKDSDRSTVADVGHPAKHGQKVHDPASAKDGHPDNHPGAKAG